MARMLYYVSLKFEGCPVPDIRSTSGEIRSPRDKKVRLTAVSNFAERHVLRARRRVSHTRAADAHVHAAETHGPGFRMHHSSMQYYGRRAAAALWKIWVIRKRLQGPCRGNFSFRFSEKSCGRDESER